MKKLEEHYINFNSANWTSLHRIYGSARLSRGQSVDSLVNHLNTLVDYLHRLDPTVIISDKQKLATLESALELSSETHPLFLEVVRTMRTLASTGQPYTYEGLQQNLHLMETSTPYQEASKKYKSRHVPDKNRNRNETREMASNVQSDSDSDSQEHAKNIQTNTQKCSYCMKNGREHVAHTHSIDKCFHKQSAEKNKNGKMKNKDSTNKDSMHKKQLLMLTETINNILNADETIPKKKGKINSRRVMFQQNSDSETSDEEVNMITEFSTALQINAAILDSGASAHIHRRMPMSAHNYKEKVEYLKLPNGQVIPSEGRVDTEHEKNVMIVPSIHTDLYSTGAYDKAGCATIHVDGKAYVLSVEETNKYRTQLLDMVKSPIVEALKRAT